MPEITPSQSAQPSHTDMPITQIPYTPVPALAVSAKAVTSVSVFLNATQSLMGYVDLQEKNTYISALETIHSAVSVAFPQARLRAARVSLPQREPEWLNTNSYYEQVASNPSFYLVNDLIYEPQWIRLAGMDAKSEGARMNEFTRGFYTSNGVSLNPDTTEAVNPTTQSVEWIINAEADLTIIVTDLRELQSGRAMLADAIQNAVNRYGYAFGIIAQDSSFSGLIPVSEGNDTVWYEWGSMPTGSARKIYDYGFLTIGESIDPAARKTEARPFYILCIGNSDAVSGFINRYKQDVSAASIAMAHLDTYILDHQYTSMQALATYVQDSGFTAGIYQDPGSGKDGTLSSYQMTNPLKDDKDRPITITFTYMPNGSDPRWINASFDSDAFRLNASVLSVQKEGNRPTDSSGIYVHGTQVRQNVDGTVTVRVTMAHPYDSVPSGQFRVDIGLDILPPTMSNLPGWALDRNADVLWQSQGKAFDGSKTIGLSAFMETMQTYYRDKLEPTHLGDVSYTVSIQ
jgi:hypothetical protein